MRVSGSNTGVTPNLLSTHPLSHMAKIPLGVPYEIFRQNNMYAMGTNEESWYPEDSF